MTADELAAKLPADSGYVPQPAGDDDRSYLDSLGLPPEVDGFYRSHAPATSIGWPAELLSIEDLRAANASQRGSLLRSLGCTVIAMARGNPYFCLRTGDGYEIRLADAQDLADGVDSEIDLAGVLAHSAEAPVFTAFADFLDAFAASKLPTSPHERVQVHAYHAWRADRQSSA